MADRCLNEMIFAMCEANKKNIMHRDIKPENILLQKDSLKKAEFMVKLTDFGVSKIYYDTLHAATKHRTGTYFYIACEEFEDNGD